MNDERRGHLRTSDDRQFRRIDHYNVRNTAIGVQVGRSARARTGRAVCPENAVSPWRDSNARPAD
jgi:hypothetical protein